MAAFGERFGTTQTKSDGGGWAEMEQVRTAMGSRSISGGVLAIGTARIRFDFTYEGVRYRPSLPIAPTEGNLRRARQYLQTLKQRIRSGTFSFAEDFPNFRDLDQVPGGGNPKTCNEVFDAFVAHCESRLAKGDMAAVTVCSYQKVLDRVWRLELGATRFLSVRYSTLVRIADHGR